MHCHYCYHNLGEDFKVPAPCPGCERSLTTIHGGMHDVRAYRPGVTQGYYRALNDLMIQEDKRIFALLKGHEEG